MTTRTTREALRRTAITALLALGLSGSCALHRQVGIEEVLQALTAADRKIDNFCSLERSSTYDRNGRLKEGDRRGVHFYSKPDESLLCVYAPSSPCNIYYEMGTIVKSREDGRASERTLSDSFFLRDWRSLMLLRQTRAESAGSHDRRGAVLPVKFEFAAGDGQKSPWHADGVYDIQITRPNYERAVLRVNVLLGVILEKSVYQLPGGNLAAREIHSDFIPMAGTYLPGKTIYEYGEKTVVIYWSDYRANLPIDLARLNMDEATCERLAALTTPVHSACARRHRAAAGTFASLGVLPLTSEGRICALNSAQGVSFDLNR